MILTLLGALVIGLTLGLLGSGGSILTVPVLVYVAREPEKLAIAESLLIVGAVAAFGAWLSARRGQVVGRAVLAVGVPGIVGAWAGGWISRGVDARVQLLALAVLMLVAAVSMLRGSRYRPPAAGRVAAPVLALQGMALGAATGFVGVGGGFLIVPVLVLASGLSLSEAVGTSLAVITLNALAGFVGHVPGLARLGLQVSWPLVGLFVSFGVAGVWAGQVAGRRLPQDRLRQVFAVFLVVLAVWMFIEQVWSGSIAW